MKTKKTAYIILIILIISCVEKSNKTIEKNKDSLITLQTNKKDSIKKYKKTEYHTYVYKDKEIAKIPKTIITQLPKKFSAIDVDSGYLNDDNLKDYIIAIRRNDEEIDENGNAPKRRILILLGQESGKFVLAKSNDKNAVLGLDYGANRDDPFLGVFLGKNNSFSIDHGVASGNQHWSQFTYFKYDKKLKNWILTKDELTVYSEKFDAGFKLDKQYGLPIRFHEIKTRKNSE